MSKSAESPSRPSAPLYRGTIGILDAETVERISAGEVVERPASVVKELIENSLDAGARSIVAEVDGAGKKLIRVSDDGCGIPSSEMPRVFLRHATSKISSYDDLFRLSTMGFRGEAMAAISAVADVTVKSCPRTFSDGKPTGAKIRSSYSKISGVSPAAVPGPGTAVEVRGLFANTAARLKFLKSDSSEKIACISVAQALAMSRHDVSFALTSDGKTVFRWPAADSPDGRLAQALKREIFGQTAKFDAVAGDIGARGRVSVIDAFVASAKMQWTFVNGRPVRSGAVSSAIYEAAKEFMPRGRHPVFAVFLEVPPEKLDANVSPTKREVKFSDDAAVFDVVRRAVRGAISGGKPVVYSFAPSGGGSYLKCPPPSAPYETGATPAVRRPATPDAGFLAAELAASRVKFIGAVFGYCILAADEENLFLIDSHAASERVLYEKYRRREYSRDCQMLLAPVVLDLPPAVFAEAARSVETLNSIGWKLGVFGESSLKCDGTPAVLGDVDARAVLTAVFDGARTVSEEEIIKKSCRAAVRGKDRPGFMEAQRLINELFDTPNYQTCPHGRPTVVKITPSELAAKFRRNY